MRKNKLFIAAEEFEGEIADVEFETSPEEGEVAAVQQETEAEIIEIEDNAEGVEEGIEAADQLEEVQEVVEASLDEEQTDGEGLDPVAAEAIRIAVEAICARVGANPKAVTHLYAHENFSSASSRKANTKFALEGVGEFLKNLWEKIKAAISGLWKKLEAFWNKHGSALGRTMKALEALKAKVGSLKGSPSFDLVEVPAGLQSVFPTKANLGVSEIKAFGKTLSDAVKASDGVFKTLEGGASVTDLSGVDKIVKDFKSGITVEIGSENAPVPGGKYFQWVFKADVDKDGDVEIVTLDIDEDHGEFDEGRKDAQLDIASKDELKGLVKDAIDDVKADIKRRDRAEKISKDINKALKNIGSAIDKMDEDKKATARASMRSFQLLMTKAPTVETKLAAAKMAMYRGVIAYVNTCAANYRNA